MYWVKLIIITGGTQIFVQAIGLISGILIIRLMSVKEYAWYTIANTMLGTLSLLSDGGISTGVMAEGAKVWYDKNKLGKVLTTGMFLRRRFAIGSLVVSIPVLVYLLMHQQASLSTAILISLCLIPAFCAALSDNLLEIPLKLNRAIIPLQKNQILASVLRFLLLFPLYLFPFTGIALLVNGIPRVWANIKLRKLNLVFVQMGENANVDTDVKISIIKIVKRSLPGVIYFCVSGQITIWLLSIFGNSASIAGLGGLGRILILFTLISSVLNNLLIPAFAKLPINKYLLKNISIKILLGLILISIFIIGSTYFIKTYILLLLGVNYAGLESPLFLNVIASCISLIGGVFLGLNMSRGWIINPFVSISVSLVFFVLGLISFDVSTLIGVVKLNILTAVAQLVIHTSYTFYKIYHVQNEYY